MGDELVTRSNINFSCTPPVPLCKGQVGGLPASGPASGTPSPALFA